MAPTSKASGTKRQTRKNKKWNVEDMESALKAVKDGASISNASQNYGIPWQTLKDRVSGKHDTTTVGRKTCLTANEELVLISYIQYMASIGQPLTSNQTICMGSCGALLIPQPTITEVALINLL